jgi:methyl-accepting chemotaxis protein
MFQTSVAKLVLFLQVIVISLLMLGAAYMAVDSIRHLQASRLAVELVSIDKALFLGTTATRGVLTPTQTALQTKEAPKQIIAELRQKSAEKLDSAVAALKDAPITGRDALLGSIQSAWTDVLKLQADVDADALKPLADRDIARMVPWRNAVFKLGDNLMTAGGEVSNAVRLTDPTLAELVQIRRLAWRIRDSYGSQCAFLRPSVAKNQALEQTAYATWNQGRGSYLAAWTDLDLLLARPGIAASLVNAAKSAQAATTAAQATVDKMVAALGASDKTAPATFSDACNAPNDIIVDIAFRALDLATERADELQRAAYVEIIAVLAVAALALASILYSLLALRRRFALPISGLMLAVDRLSRRDFSEPVLQTGYADEIGAMAHALESLRESAQAAETLEHQANEARDKELTRSRNVEHACREFESGSFATLSVIEKTADKLATTSANMRELAGESSRRAAAAAQNASEVTTNVQTVAAATEELSASINDISTRASAGAHNAEQAVLQANDTRQTVDALNSAVQKIGEVVALINGIAAQTNLLALNATIEAARAGEAGKGFAVVAGEVKNLANQTARATEDIGRQIEDIQTATSDAVSAIGTMGKTITHINEAVAAIAQAAEQQQQATQEISASIQKAAQSTQLATEDVGQVAQANQRTGEAASDVMESVTEQQKQQDLLKSAVETFINRVKAM